MSDPTCGLIGHYRQLSNVAAGLVERDCACKVDCPKCGVKAGRTCTNATSTGGWSTGTQFARMHAARFKTAGIEPVLLVADRGKP